MRNESGQTYVRFRHSLPLPHSSSIRALWAAVDNPGPLNHSPMLLEALRADAALAVRCLELVHKKDQFGSIAELHFALKEEQLRALALQASIDFLTSAAGSDWYAVQQHLFGRHHLGAMLCAWLAEERGELATDQAEIAGLLVGLGPWLEFAAAPQKFLDDLPSQSHLVENIDRDDLERMLLVGCPLSAELQTALRHYQDDWSSLIDAPALVRIVKGAVMVIDDADAIAETARELQIDEQRLRTWLEGQVMRGMQVQQGSAGEDWQLLRRELGMRLQTAASAGFNQEVQSIITQAAQQLPGCVDVRVFASTEGAELVPDVISDPQLNNISISWQRGSSAVSRTVREGVTLQTANMDETRWMYVVPTALDAQLAFAMNVDGLLCVPLHADAEIGSSVRRVLVLGMSSEGLTALAADQWRLMGFLSMVRMLLQDNSAAGSNGQQRIREAVHEARNPLTAITNMLYLLGDRFDESSDEAGLLALINTEIKHLQQTLEALSRPEESGPEVVDLHELLDSVANSWRENARHSGNDVEIVVVLDPSLVKVELNGQKLRQAIINLVKNAVEAQPDGGRVTVICQNSVNFDGKTMFAIDVKDEGPGLPDEIRHSLYQSAVSQKGNEQRGVGLKIVRKLVSELEGHLFCETQAGKGTEFRLLLPRKLCGVSVVKSSKVVGQ